MADILNSYKQPQTNRILQENKTFSTFYLNGSCKYEEGHQSPIFRSSELMSRRTIQKIYDIRLSFEKCLYQLREQDEQDIKIFH